MKLLALASLFSVFCMFGNQFSIKEDDGREVPIRSEHLDSILRSITNEQDLTDYIKSGNGFKLSKDTDGYYRLDSKIGLKGGGAILATLGFVGVHTVGFTLMFAGALGINVALPGVGGLAVTAAGGGSMGGWMAVQNALAVKAACAGALALPWC